MSSRQKLFRPSPSRSFERKSYCAVAIVFRDPEALSSFEIPQPRRDTDVNSLAMRIPGRVRTPAQASSFFMLSSEANSMPYY